MVRLDYSNLDSVRCDSAKPNWVQNSVDLWIARRASCRTTLGWDLDGIYWIMIGWHVILQNLNSVKRCGTEFTYSKFQYYYLFTEYQTLRLVVAVDLNHQCAFHRFRQNAVRCGSVVRICGADLNIVTKCGVGLNQRYWILQYHGKHRGSAADILRACWFLRAHCLYIVFLCGSTADLLRIYCGSAAGLLILAGPLFIYSVSMRIYCGSVADLLRICCGPVDSCWPTVYRCFFANKQLQTVGPQESTGPQQIRCRSAVDP